MGNFDEHPWRISASAINFLIRKLERRLIRGPSYTPTMAEVDLLVTVMGYVEILDEDELLLLRRLQRAQESRLSPTLGRAKTQTLARLLRRAPGGPRSRWI